MADLPETGLPKKAPLETPSPADASPEGAEVEPLPCPDDGGGTALVLTGGGARSAYQVGVLRGIAKLFPDANIPILAGVSGGGINAVHLAAHTGSLEQSTGELKEMWSGLQIEDIFNVHARSLGTNLLRWGFGLLGGGSKLAPRMKSLVDSAPLRDLLHRELATVDGEIVGIERNIEAGRLRALALTTINYNTGQTVTWIQGCDIGTWERPQRRARQVRMTVEHVMASAALPLLFPAVRLGDHWHGDGGIRLAAPLSPAIHLGADRLLIISTRREPTMAQADVSSIAGYPPLEQIFGKLVNAVFLDIIDQDVARLERINSLIAKVPEDERGDFRLIKSHVVRPSADLGRLAADYEANLPQPFKFLTRGLGTKETKSPDSLSMLMFQHDYVSKLIAIGEQDAEAQAEELAPFFED